MKKWMAAIGLVLLMLVGVMPITVKAAAPAVSGSVWVGGEELKNIGDFVKSSDGNGGQATLYATSIGPALVLDNYVYEGDGYEYDTGCYAGIYYAANNPLYIILGTDINGIASENSITITAENATESYGIFINTNYTNNLFIDGSMNNAADALTVIGGVATNQSSGIKVTNGLKNNSKYSTNVAVYTSEGAESTTMLYIDGNFTVNAIGGAVSGEGAYSAGMDLVQGGNWNESVFDKGTFYATGGEASNGISYGIKNSVVNDATDLYFEFTGATVTAAGGTAKSGSYGIVGKEVVITGGTVTANAGNTTGGTETSTSAGISCTILTVSSGTVNATGGKAEGYAFPNSYGINCIGAATFSGGEIAATGGTASYENLTGTQFEANTYGIYAETMTFSGANVTAIGGTCGGHVSGASRSLRYSYGCYGDITMTSGSLTATGGNLLMEDSTTGGRYSYGIYGGITAGGGTINVTGGNTIGGNSYGIYLNKDSTFSGTAVVTASTKTESTDDYRYGIYAKEVYADMAMTISVEGSASVTATVAEAARLGTSGIYVNSGYITFIQTGGTVVASAPTKDDNQAGAYFINANISGGTFDATAKTMAFYAYELNLTGGVITGTANSTLEDTLVVDSTGIQIGALTMTGGSITGQGGKSSTSASYGVRIVSSANVSGGTITGTGGRVSSETLGVMSYGIEAPNLTLSGGTVTGTAGQASSSSIGVYITSSAIISKDAKLMGQGGISDCSNTIGIFGKNMSVADSAIVTGTGGQASAGNSTGISLSGDFAMSEGSSAQVTGNGGEGDSSRGMYFSCSSNSLAGGTLTATGGASYTTESLGIYIYYYDFLMDGTLVTATGATSAVGGDDKLVYSEAMVASTDMNGTNPVTLQSGSHSVSSLTKYKYLKAGTIGQLGVTPGKRDISDAVINLGPTLTYNGSGQTMTVSSVMLGGVDLLANGFVTVTDNIATDVGTYSLKVIAKEESLYTGSATKEFTVKPMSITPVVTVKETSYPYKSTIDPSDVIVKYGETELVLDKDYTIYFSYTSTVGENAGYVEVQSKDGSNYYWNGTVMGTFTVGKVENPVVVTTPVTVIRGGNWVNLNYSNNQAGTTPSYSFDGDALGCTITNGTLTSGDAAGTVTVKVTFPASEQYNEAVRTITVTITDKNTAELSGVSLADADYKYKDETKLAQVYHSEPGSRVKEDIIEYSGTTRSGATYARSTTPPTQAGNYTVHVTYETKDTIYTGSDDFVIRPKDISSLVTVTLGEALTYNGTEQTQTVAKVYDANADYTFDETEYDITGNKQTDASNYYSLDISGKGNFTGTKTVSYTIAKAIPTLGDFEIPPYDATVDYTGAEVILPLPTTNKIGMGDTYIETYVRDAGTYAVTFKVYEGVNYTAATGLVYGTLTVNQIDRPTTITNAEVILGGNEINLDNYVSTEGSPAKAYEIVGEKHGCSISNGVFTSGSEACTVTVQVTLEGNKNYKATVKTFNVTVKAKNTASLTVTQDDVEYDFGKEIWDLSPDFDGQAGTLVSQTMVYEGTLWNGSSYASSETKPTQAGTYTVTVTYESEDTIYTGSTIFKVNPKKITGDITLGDALTYTGAPLTQTIAQVQTGDYTYTEADYDISGNVQTNAGQYILTLTGKGNFTGTMSAYYTIAKAIPQRSDFDIPELIAVDYTGEEITVGLPTSIRDGMGEVYLTGGNGIINAGSHKITFGVHRGQNYEAASGFEYGTLTVNKVAHPMKVTNAIVGIGYKNIDLSTRVTTEFGYSVTFEFVTPEEERLGCQINGATFTSGKELGTVTVRATVSEGTNYLETSKTFTVTVVEEGGVKVWGVITSSGNSNDETTIQLIQDDVVKYEMTKVGNSPTYTFDGVAAGTYTLRISKANHLTHEQEITVASEDVHVETVELKLYKFGQTAQIRLIEPWGLKANVRVHDGVAANIDYSELFDYGVYFIRASDLDVEGATQETLTIENIIRDGDVTHMAKDSGVTVEGNMLTAIYDKKLYTYEFSDSIFVLFYIVPSEGDSRIYAPIRERNMSELINTRKDDSVNFTANERLVFTYMSKLEADILDYRSDFENPSVSPEQNAPTLSENPLSGVIANTGTYSFGHTVQIRLIEPWGLKVNARVYTKGMSSSESIDYAELVDYGVVIVMDNNTSISTPEELLARSDAYVFSKANGEAQVNGTVITAAFTKDIYTYLLNSNVYVMFYIEDAEGYHFGAVKERNVYELMKTRRDDTSGSFTEKEKALFDDMVNLYDAVTIYRADYIN
ncbi:MAG: hypothetical protein IKK03_02835 [Lachnospiraceae bacterium]|nr:hypothetical protein [Lachnospiraceae bacterium]